MALPLTKTREKGTSFETGRPVSFTFIRNTEKSPYFGARFQQDIEPAGRYILFDTDPTSPLPRSWIRGTAQFKSPIVLRFSESGRYDEFSWKHLLARHYRARGAKLSRALLRAGYDGIVTVGDDGETREIVDLKPVAVRKAARDVDLPGVRRVVDVRAEDDIRGIGWKDNNEMVTYHVTDRPIELVRFLRRARNLVASYGEKGASAELGPGLYVSGNPDFWVARARGKWSFLKSITRPELDRLTRALRREIERLRQGRRITEGEYENALRDLRYVAEDRYEPDTLIQFAGQPYSVAFWQPAFLEPLGIRPGATPGVVEVRLRGRFAELERSRPSASLLRTLRRARLQGAFTRAGMSSNPELVVWDRRAITSARVVDSNQ